MEQENQTQYSPIMAIVDFIPVITFGIGGVIAYIKLSNIIFLVSIIICTLAGLFKAGWKMIIATTTKDYKILTKLFHILMPSGFVLMIASIFFTLESFKNLLINMFNMPSLIFSILGCIGMMMMIVFAIKLDSKKASSNWIEQTTNTISQLFFVIALLLIK